MSKRKIVFRGKQSDGDWLIANLWSFAFYVSIDEDTVGEYTGLKDKNGTMIFEGDVVVQPWSHGAYLYTVKYEYAGFSPFVDEDKAIYPEECIVLGNIVDNPELKEMKEGWYDDGQPKMWDMWASLL